MSSPFLNPSEIKTLLGLPPTGHASLAELSVKTRMAPAALLETLSVLQRRRLVLASNEECFQLTAFGRSARRSIDPGRVNSASGPVYMLDNTTSTSTDPSSEELNSALDHELGPSSDAQ
jgi:hypothetical protein